jgi:hypothetical protein
MLTAYRKLLHFYPAEHREQFGDEMADVFRQAEQGRVGPVARVAFHLKELAGILNGALREHLRILVGAHAAVPLYTRRFTMRNGFRFPKTTAVLMILILAGILIAIQRGESIATSIPHLNEPLPLPPIHYVHFGLIWGIPWMFGFFCAAGLIGWVILFALRRSGVHRLDEISADRK